MLGVLEIKAELGIHLKAAYDSDDRKFLRKTAEEILPDLICRSKCFRDCMETQWMTENKPFGFEIQDIRIGGLIQRLKTAKRRVEQYLNGELCCIDELENARLPYISEKVNSYIGINEWQRIVSASII